MSKRVLTRENLIVVLLIAISGNPVVPRLFVSDEVALLCAVALISLLADMHRRLRLSREDKAVFLTFAGLLMAQGVLLNSFHWATMAGFLCRLFIGFAVMQIVPRFPQIFCRVMVWMALIGLFFWLFQVSGLVTYVWDMISALPWNQRGSSRYSILLHTFIYRGGQFVPRNSGMFWEPGAFASYLNLAMVFLAFARESIPVRLRKRYFCILFAACLSTMSTTGYLVLPLVYLLYAPMDSRRDVISQCLVSLLVAASFTYASWHNFAFVGEKVMTQYEAAINQTHPAWHINRLGSAILDWEYIRQRPLTGWGLHSETRWRLHPNFGELELEGRGNGLSHFTACFGFVGLGTFVGMVWLNFFRLSGGRNVVSAFAVSIIVIMLNGECLLNYPLFLGLMFLSGGRQHQRRATLLGLRKPGT